MARKRKAPSSAEVETAAVPEAGPAADEGPVEKEPEEDTDTTAAAAAAAAHPFTPLPLRQVHRLLEPGPVLLVSTGAVADGSHNLMTLGFHMMLQHSGPTLVAVCLGPWDATFAALRSRGQCVLAVPAAEMAEAVVDIGNCSKDDVGDADDADDADGDVSGDVSDRQVPHRQSKWERFGLTPLPARAVRAPLVGGPHVLANIECVVHDRQLVGRYSLWILRAVRAWWDEDRVQRTGRMLHHRGNGVFAVSSGDGVVDLHERMTKWPELA